MSEFSESYHLRSNHHEDGIALLKSAGLQGYLFPGENGWVTILPEGKMFFPNEPLINANRGKLLHYIFAEDHGWNFEIYAGDQCVCEYSVDWNGDEEEIEESENIIDELFSLIKTGDEKKDAAIMDAIKEFFPPDDSDEQFDHYHAYQFADMIGLKHYYLLSVEHVKSNLASGNQLYSGVIVVD